MGSESEPAKLLLPYLQRADELQKHEPLVAYYCRLYAMERGLKIPNKERTKTTNSLLISLMNQLEKDKKSLKLGPEDSLYVEGFASNVFAKADKQDRAGRADLNTAKTFYAASIFYEILNQFGELHPDLEQKQKYAAWKAADIRKALKEGRKPVPGPPSGDDDDQSIPSRTSSGGYDLGQAEAKPAANPHGPGADRAPSFHDNIDNQRVNTLARAPSYPTAQFPSNDYQHTPPANTQENYTYAAPYSHHPSQHDPPQHFPQNYPSQDPYQHENQQHPPPNYPSQETYQHDNQQHIPPSYSSQEAYQLDNQPHITPNYPSQKTYQHDNQQDIPPNYPFQEAPSPSYSYPSFQTFPSFSESSLPTAPSHYPSYHHSHDSSYLQHSAQQSAPSVPDYQSTTQYSSGGRKESHAEPEQTPVQPFQYDPNYQPPPEKIAEAHKAARFAVGALAFDDVAVAVDFLRKSLELLTNPSASTSR